MESQKYNELIAPVLFTLINCFVPDHAWVGSQFLKANCIYIQMWRSFLFPVTPKKNGHSHINETWKGLSVSSRNNLDTFQLQNPPASFSDRHGSAIDSIMKQDAFQKLFLRNVSHLIFEGLRALSCPSLLSITSFWKVTYWRKKMNSFKWPQLMLLVETAKKKKSV